MTIICLTIYLLAVNCRPTESDSQLRINFRLIQNQHTIESIPYDAIVVNDFIFVQKYLPMVTFPFGSVDPMTLWNCFLQLVHSSLPFQSFYYSCYQESLTPLHLAVQNGFTDGVRWLLNHSADLEAIDDQGQSPLLLACRRDQSTVAERRIESGANLNHVSRVSYAICSPLHSRQSSEHEWRPFGVACLMRVP